MESSKQQQQFKGKQESRMLLYVDALNYSRRFFNDSNFWNLKKPFIKIRRFVDAARKSGIDIEVYIDAGMQTKEALTKWRTRREAQVKKCEMNVPTCLSQIYGDMFRGLKVPVWYSDVDNDDTLASYAHFYGACILSQDKDFFRYTEGRFPIYHDFIIDDKGYLILQRAKEFDHPKKRSIIQPPPNVFEQYPIIPKIHQMNEYLRGCPSALTKYTGNLQRTFTELRAYFYFQQGINFPVNEKYPEWDPEQEEVYWTQEIVEPVKNMFKTKVLDIRKIIDYYKDKVVRPDILKDDELAWSNHLYAFAALISEILAKIFRKPMHVYIQQCQDYMTEIGMMNKIDNRGKKHTHKLKIGKQQIENNPEQEISNIPTEQDELRAMTDELKATLQLMGNLNIQTDFNAQLKDQENLQNNEKDISIQNATLDIQNSNANTPAQVSIQSSQQKDQQSNKKNSRKNKKQKNQQKEMKYQVKEKIEKVEKNFDKSLQPQQKFVYRPKVQQVQNNEQ
ncbi:UNKNOWN [Stylonychia lemnae]|uniref:Asteroid domain-containing protein n=1 Tax=Stylonychia lemnae TaxID=5949 RepID=A0A078B044_STYLE|nr:UNKNOWN [Stylonychia lemnae]|eukprot:CDW88040.1 UNKNOWN [Stylonychia lemnae]